MFGQKFSFFQLKRFYSLSFVIFLNLCVFLCIVALCVFFKTQEKQEQEILDTPIQKSYLPEPKDYKSLSTRQNFASAFMKDLTENLKFYGKNTRPDETLTRSMYLVGIQADKGPFYLKACYKYFLKYTQNSKLVFSNIPTPFWIEIDKVVDNKLFVKAYFLRSDEENSDPIKEERSFKVEKSSVSPEFISKYIDNRAWAKSLELSSVWGADKFFDVYGSEDPNYEKNSFRLAFNLEDPNFLYVKEKTLLIWDGGLWRKPKKQENTLPFPIALIHELTSSNAQITLWDCSGVFSKKISLPVQRSSALESSLEKEFSKIRQRSSSRVTCKMGKKTALLKEGDWVLKTASGWKVLKRIEELEKYISLKSKGELFVFDRIEKVQGSHVLKGRLFDSMRTSYQTIRIPISKKKKNKQLHSKKNENLTKMVDSRDEDFDDGIDPDDFDDEDEELLRYTHNL